MWPENPSAELEKEIHAGLIPWQNRCHIHCCVRAGSLTGKASMAVCSPALLSASQIAASPGAASKGSKLLRTLPENTTGS